MASIGDHGLGSPNTGSPVSRHGPGEHDVADSGAAVAGQRPHPNHHLPTSSSNGAMSYGGTEANPLCRTPKGSEEMTGDSADVVVPVAADHSRGRAAVDGEGECIVADSDDAAGNTNTWKGRIRHFLLNNDPLLYAALKWGLAVLLLLFLTVIVCGMLFQGVLSSSNCTATGNDTLVEGMPGWCHTRFGTILGVADGVYSYSNCNDDYVSIADAYVSLSVPTVDSTGTLTTTTSEFYTGLQWQCVEYARRYWMMNGRPKPAYFGSVDWAADIWNLTEVHLLENSSKTLPLHRFKSGDRVVRDGLEPPEVGDIIIYPVQPGGFPVGHVAVITKVEVSAQGYINVAEQNWGSMQWPGPYHNHSRRIPLHYDHATTAITLNDPAGKIVGWMRYG